jgi:hypothetical protein
MTTTPVAVRATAWSFQRSQSQRGGSLDPSPVMLLAGVTSTTLSISYCVGPSTDTPGLSSTVCSLSASSRAIPGPMGGYLLGAPYRR